MADLLRDVTADTTGTGAQVTGPLTVFVEANSVFDGAQIPLKMAKTNTANEYQEIHRFTGAGAINVNVTGTFYLRADVEKANTTGDKKTSVSCETI